MSLPQLTEREKQLSEDLFRQAPLADSSSGGPGSRPLASDPLRILTEFVACVAGQIRADIEQIPSGLIHEIPALFGLGAEKAKPARAFVRISLGDKISESFYLPADTDFSISNASQSFHFRSRESLLLFSVGQMDIVYEKGALFLGFERLPQSHNPRFYFELESSHERVKGQWSILTESTWLPLSTADRTEQFSKSGFIQFFLSDFDLRSQNLHGQNRIWLQFRSEAQQEVLPVRQIYDNVVECENSKTYTELCLGSGDARVSQTFSLPHGQVTDDFQVKVFNGEKGGFELWHQVSNFLLSSDRSNHFTYDPKNSEIQFGDGYRGRRLPPGYDNVWIESLSLCDGSAANLGREAEVALSSEDWRIQSLALISDIQGGVDAVTGQDQIKRLRALLINRQRAVTLKDFEDLAVELAPRVGRAYAQYKDFGVLVLPILKPNYSKKASTLNFEPRDSDLEFLKRELQDLKLLNTDMRVQSPSYRAFRVEASIFIKTLTSENKTELEETILSFFSPFGPLQQRVRPGMMIQRDEFHQFIEKIPEVITVRNLRIIDEVSKLCVDQLDLVHDELPAVKLALKIEERMR
ncbi:MAG: hypothetical protein EA369_07410 [Bradymonadales bacterium]|nr:MAG: hypothetical protein EA369_07410 [Bradymonadales bacterium]